MAASPPRRKVLIIEDEPTIRNTLYVLLAGLGCETDIAYTGQQALAMISRQHFDAVLLDLRCNNVAPNEVVAGIKELRPSLVGRILVITGEVNGPQTMQLIEQYSLPHVNRSRLMQELWARLRGLFGLTTSPHAAS